MPFAREGPLGCRIVTLWIGEILGPVERACLRSMIRHGHPVALYCYAVPAGVPHGIEVRDAATVVPEECIIRHRKSGSPALFSNRFRYELQRRAAGTWADCDNYLLAPIDGSSPYLMGIEEPGVISNGVFRAPPDCPLLGPLLRLFEESEVPWWLPWRERAAAHWRLKRTGRTDLAAMPWGSAGPLAVSALAKLHGLYEQAVPSDIFYPVHWRNADWIRDPTKTLDEMITPRSVSVHLFNEKIKTFKNQPAPPGSFLARLHEEGSL